MCTKKPKYKCYTVDEINTLLNTIEGKERLYHMIKLTAFYGLRRSEVLGLKWSAVDFDHNVFTINHTLAQGNTKIKGQDKTKNASSKRSLPLTMEIKDLLLEVMEDEKRNRELYGNTYIENDYVFKWENGTLYRPNFISTKWTKILKKYNMENKITFHQLRHSCASMLLKQGFPLAEISEWCGHSSIQITKDTYGHLDFESKIDLAKGMAESFGVTRSAPENEGKEAAAEQVMIAPPSNIIDFVQRSQSKEILRARK